ncbi:MAG TPA: DUF4091 domain-containing protein [Candidatus Hydrogenedentes bacterium]|nr:DUF4091 domain-containing protein [Candidatus Hydrogenedentota bacterium]HQL94633.1 DUF4091 domain-containing protein [Candidatus Hydrogenedentota bacterium]
MRNTFLAIVLIAAGQPLAFTQTVDTVNPSFEEGDSPDAPLGWMLSGGEGGVDTALAKDGSRSLWIRGTGQRETLSFWQSGDFSLDPGKPYLLRFFAARDGEGKHAGSAVTGTGVFNVDLYDLTEQWKPVELLFATPHREGPASFRFGQWESDFRFRFDGLQLCRAVPAHARFGAVELGAGERIAGNDYFFAPPMAENSTNVFRPTRDFTAGFNTNRMVFSDGMHLTFEHRIAEHPLKSGRLFLWTKHYGEAVFRIEASRDGTAWTEIGEPGEGEKTGVAVPEALLPAESLWIRLSVSSTSGGSVQMHGYRIEAALDGLPLTAKGDTRWFAVEELADGMDLSVEAPGLFSPDAAEAGVTLHVRQNGAEVGGEAALLDGDAVFSQGTLGAPLAVPSESGMHPLTVEAKGVRLRHTLEISEYFSTAYGERLGDGLWWASSGWKIPRGRPLPTAEGKAVRIETARNEAEAAQLVVRPKQPLRGVTVTASTLEGPGGAVIPPEGVSILRVRYVPVTMPTDKTGVAAPWPDPLPPQTAPVDIPAGENQPYWVRVKPAKDTPPGEYRGTLRVAAGGYAEEVPLEVRVFGFTLPDRMTCTSAFGMDISKPLAYHGVSAEADQRRVVDAYLRALADHHISPYAPAPFDPFTVRWPEVSPDNPPADPEALEVSIDWTRYDRAMAEAFEKYHFNTFSVPMEGMGGGTYYSRTPPSLLGFPEESPVYRRLFGEYCRQVEAHLREKGWLDDGFVYWFDEPEPKDYAFVMNGFLRLKEAAPGIHRMLTEEIHDELTGGPNIWCPLTPEWREKEAQARQALGERIWWYICTGPKAPHATLFIDHPGTELRVWLWQTWQRGVQGLLIWETLLWNSPTAYPDPEHPQNPYEDPMGWEYGYGNEPGRRPWGNGDGRFLYPPESVADGRPAGPVFEPPVDTVRIEMLRDGIEDYEYLALLRRALDEKGGGLAEEERGRLEALLTVPPEITESLTQFTKDPAPIEARRRQIAETLESLTKKP